MTGSRVAALRPTVTTGYRRIAYHWLDVFLADQSRGSLLDVLRHGAWSAPAARSVYIGLSRTGPEEWTLEVDGTRSQHLSELRAAESAYRRVHEAVLAAARARRWVRLHAAIVDWDGTRLLLAGPSGAGKTTLAARLMVDQADVQGDEAVFIRDGVALALPRRLHVRGPTLRLLPQLRRRPAVTVLPYDPPLWTFDPGHRQLRAAAVRHVVLIDPIHSGASQLTSIGSAGALGELAAEALPYAPDAASAIRELSAVLRQANCHRLRLGDLDSAVEQLYPLIRGATT
jgi:hypothetical protein